MSSKFNRYPTPRLRPPICFPPPGSCWPQAAHGQPFALNIYYQWQHIGANGGVNRTRVDKMPRLPADVQYRQTWYWPNGSLTVWLHPETTPNQWRIALHSFIAPFAHDDYEFRHIYSIYDPRFDTGLLTRIFVPDIFFIEVHVRGAYLQWAPP